MNYQNSWIILKHLQAGIAVDVCMGDWLLGVRFERSCMLGKPVSPRISLFIGPLLLAADIHKLS